MRWQGCLGNIFFFRVFSKDVLVLIFVIGRGSFSKFYLRMLDVFKNIWGGDKCINRFLLIQ